MHRALMMHRRIRWVFLFSAFFGLVLSGQSFAADRSVIVGFKQKPGPAEKAMVRAAGGKVGRTFGLIPAMVVSVPEEKIAGIKGHGKVAYVESDAPVMAIAPLPGGSEYENSWGVSRIGTAEVHAQGIMGAGVKVAILDTGIDYNHPELAAQYVDGDNFIALDPNYRDPMDDSTFSHGTHVAGIIAAALNDSGVVGVAPAVELYAAKVLDGGGFGTISSLLAGLEWAKEQGVDIVNISIGASQSSLALEEACRAAWESGILLVAAAGNTYGGPVTYPARYDSVIAVAATERDDKIGVFSAIGPEVELAAPGSGIYSSISGGGYDYLTGTSQAAPHVVGVAALMRSRGLTDLNGDGLADSLDLRLGLSSTALDLGVVGKDQVFGYGLVQASPTEPPVVEDHVVVTKTKKVKGVASAQTVSSLGGPLTIRILNGSLKRMDVEVFKAGELIPALAASYRFGPKDPSEVTCSLEESGGALDVVLTPFGKTDSYADVFIRHK